MAPPLPQTDALSDVRPDGVAARYRRALSGNRLLVAATVVAAVAAQVLSLLVATPRYEATAELLVTPVPADAERFVGLPVLRQLAYDPTRTMRTAATLVQTRAAATTVARALGPPATPEQILDVVSVEPVGQTDVLGVTAAAGTKRDAAELANRFAQAILIERQRALRQAARAQIARVEAQLGEGGGGSSASGGLRRRLTTLSEAAAGEDPSLSLAEPAHPPEHPARPPALFLLLLAALEGFVIGSIASVARQALVGAVRDEREATALYPLPVLARVPVHERRRRRTTTAPAWSRSRAREAAFRTLLAQLQRDERGRVLMITSACAGDGRTTSAIDLAAAIAETGESVILLDLDLRRPAIGRALGLRPVPLKTLARSDFQLADGALARAPGLSSLSVLATQSEEGSDGSIDAVRRRLPELIEAARDSAAWVVVDTGPLSDGGDGLGILPEVDDVIVVIRPGTTDQRSFEVLRERLERSCARRPAGLVVISGEAG